MMNFRLKHGSSAPSYEEQLNAHGLTLGSKAEGLNQLKGAYNVLMARQELTREQSSRLIEGIEDHIEREMKEINT